MRLTATAAAEAPAQLRRLVALGWRAPTPGEVRVVDDADIGDGNNNGGAADTEAAVEAAEFQELDVAVQADVYALEAAAGAGVDVLRGLGLSMGCWVDFLAGNVLLVAAAVGACADVALRPVGLRMVLEGRRY